MEEIDQDPLKQPVFIVSAPRTGSTLLYELLTQATGLWSLGMESHGVIEGIPKLHPAHRRYRSHRLTEFDADPKTVNILRCAFLSQIKDQSGIRYLSLNKSKRPQKLRILEKTPENALRIRFLRVAFPDAFFIYLIREARQTVSSMVEVWEHGGFVNIPNLPGWESGGWSLLLPESWQQYRNRSLDEIAAFQWASSNQSIIDDLASVPREPWLPVDYHTLIARPERVLQKICEFIGALFNETLASSWQQSLKPSGTTIHYPSPTRWKYNSNFNEAVLDPYRRVIQRVDELRRDMTTTIQTKRRPAPVRFSCFLDELCYLSVQEPILSQAMGDAQPLEVDPSFVLQLGVTIPLRYVGRARFRERFLSNYPIAWIEDAAIGTLRPFWVRH